MIPERIDERYLHFNFMKNHKDEEKGNWFSKYMVFNMVQIYSGSDMSGEEECIYRDIIYELREFIKDTNYDYAKFMDNMKEFYSDEISRYIAWLCEFDKNANIIKEQYEKNTKNKVKKVHWKVLKNYKDKEDTYQKQIYEFRCASDENEKYFQEYMKKVDEAYKKHNIQKKEGSNENE